MRRGAAQVEPGRLAQGGQEFLVNYLDDLLPWGYSLADFCSNGSFTDPACWVDPDYEAALE